MLEPHPPHATPHTWKDFFLHIATIVVGLLIAVGLEQTVEAIHHHREREKLRAALQHETQQILIDSGRVETSTTAALHWLQDYEDELSAAAQNHRPPGTVRPRPSNDFDVPDEPIYKAALSGGKLPLLEDDEAAAYGELDATLLKVLNSYNLQRSALGARAEFMRKIQYGVAAGSDPLATATPDQLRQVFDFRIAEQSAIREFRFWNRQARGAATAIAHGERDLVKIQVAERQFDELP